MIAIAGAHKYFPSTLKSATLSLLVGTEIHTSERGAMKCTLILRMTITAGIMTTYTTNPMLLQPMAMMKKNMMMIKRRMIKKMKIFTIKKTTIIKQ